MAEITLVDTSVLAVLTSTEGSGGDGRRSWFST